MDNKTLDMRQFFYYNKDYYLGRGGYFELNWIIL